MGPTTPPTRRPPEAGRRDPNGAKAPSTDNLDTEGSPFNCGQLCYKDVLV